MKSALFSIPTVLVLLISTGCGAIYPQPIQVPSSAYSLPTGTSSWQLQSKYSCSGNSFIDTFQICKSNNSSDFASLLIKGQIGESKSVCVFPIQGTNAGHLGYIADPNTRLPIFLCEQIDSSGIEFSFSNNPALSQPVTSSFNSVAIVNAEDSQKMINCLENLDAACPTYSFGTFR